MSFTQYRQLCSSGINRLPQPLVTETNATPTVVNERVLEAGNNNDDMLIEEIGKLKTDTATLCVVRRVEKSLNCVYCERIP
jgi:hypothetical protein